MEEPVPSSLPRIKRRGRYVPSCPTLSPVSEAVRDAVRAVCEKHNYEPLEEMIKIRTTKVPLFRNGENVLDEKGQIVWVPLCGMKEAADIDKAILPYVYSQKPKVVDITSGGEKGITVLLAPLTAVPSTPAALPVEEEKKDD